MNYGSSSRCVRSYLPIWCALLLAVLNANCQVPSGRSPAGDFSPEAAEGDLPLKLDFNLKNGRGDNLLIHYFYGKVFVTEQVGPRTSTYNLVPTAQDWSEFWRTVDGEHIWEWGNSVDPNEPNHWSLDLARGVQSVSVEGAYEEHGIPAPPGAWKALVAALQRLIHHEPTQLGRNANS